jgi:hypothetical protein
VNQPATGQSVHYVSFGTPGGEYNRECRAATITEVSDMGTIPIGPERVSPEVVGLAVMNPTGMFFNRSVPYDAGREDHAGGTNLCEGLDYRGGTWHWPEHV